MPEESLAVVGGRVKLTLRSEEIEKAKGTGAFTVPRRLLRYGGYE